MGKEMDLQEAALALVEDIEMLAKVFHFVVPANASKVRAILAGVSSERWQEFRDPNESTQVF